jgi:uncharacterized glyoxalase superfamily protein PhnB
MAVALNPYLNFKDNTREAMTFYQSVFGMCTDRFGVSSLVKISAPAGA